MARKSATSTVTMAFEETELQIAIADIQPLKLISEAAKNTCKYAQIDLFTMHGARRHARQIQQVLDQFGHALRCGANVIERLFATRIKLPGMVLQEHIAETANRVERPA